MLLDIIWSVFIVVFIVATVILETAMPDGLYRCGTHD